MTGAVRNAYRASLSTIEVKAAGLSRARARSSDGAERMSDCSKPDKEDTFVDIDRQTTASPG